MSMTYIVIVNNLFKLMVIAWNYSFENEENR